jgi:hypothetical protein
MLGIVLILGVSVILVSTFVEQLYFFTLRHSRLSKHPKLLYSGVEWRTGSTLQLQRLAHENLGLGTWSKTDGTIPVTEHAEVLGSLDITDPKHARMTTPAGGFNSTKSQQDDEADVRTAEQRYSKLSSMDTVMTRDAPRLPSIDTGSIALSDLTDNPHIQESTAFGSRFSRRYSRLPNSQP